MTTAKAGIATSGHNISNASTEGYSRQRATSEAQVTQQLAGQGGPYYGQGSRLARIERINDSYLEKQLRDGGRDLAFNEEKNLLCWPVHHAPKLPAQRISLSPYVINQARAVMVIAAGIEKAMAVSAALESDITSLEIPIRAISLVNGKMVWLIDQAAGSALPNRL